MGWTAGAALRTCEPRWQAGQHRHGHCTLYIIIQGMFVNIFSRCQ